MTLADDIGRAMREKGQEAAVALVERRAATGDADALALFGQWRLWGVYGPRDLGVGYAAITRAASAGSQEAAFTRAALLATGTGVARDPAAARGVLEALAPTSATARRQLALLDARAPHPVEETLRTDPHVWRLDGLLSPAECAYLIERAAPLVRPSTVIDPATRRPMPNPVRDSHGAAIAPPDEDPAIHAITCRIAAATGTRWEQGEPLHLLRYTPGQQYRRHVDTLPAAANQRVLTVLVYLNDDYEGGETEFEGGLAVRGRAGDAVAFANTRPDGSADPRTAHAGRPVGHGVKWLATRWIRARPHDPWAA